MQYRITCSAPFAVFLCTFFLSSTAHAALPEPHANETIRKVISLKQSILETSPAPRNPLFLTFWDFDGTILAGDCSEGWITNGVAVYKGLAERAILGGFSQTYKGPTGWRQFWEDYQRFDERPGHWLAYPYIPQMLRGAARNEIDALARSAFDTDLRRYFFASSVEVLRGLSDQGIEIHVISASAEFFVRGAASASGIPSSNIHGIRLVEHAGKLTEELVYPVTWAEGKVRRIEELLQCLKRDQPERDAFVLGAFGNSYSTDGPFLEWTANRRLPGGRRPVVLMINGGQPPAQYQGKFQEATQTNLVGTTP